MMNEAGSVFVKIPLDYSGGSNTKISLLRPAGLCKRMPRTLIEDYHIQQTPVRCFIAIKTPNKKILD